MIYSVINMDIVGSRKLKDRVSIQDSLKLYFDELNIKYSDVLATNITFTLGDEWQIILKSPEESYNIINEINIYLQSLNIKSYSGIGFGTISTKIYNTTSEMDGEAFIYARKALNIAKGKGNNLNSKLNKVFFKANPCYFFKEEDSFKEVALTSLDEEASTVGSLNNIINVLIENTEILFNKITPKQLETILFYENLKSYSKMVDEGVANSKSSISQKLNAAEYFVFNNNKKYIKQLLSLYIFNMSKESIY
ncbi:MAG: hypothetical protein E7214_09600 [Clostridium sp.]|nr:hypothetical protein [Clostridium sp.]